MAHSGDINSLGGFTIPRPENSDDVDGQPHRGARAVEPSHDAVAEQSSDEPEPQQNDASSTIIDAKSNGTDADSAQSTVPAPSTHHQQGSDLWFFDNVSLTQQASLSLNLSDNLASVSGSIGGSDFYTGSLESDFTAADTVVETSFEFVSSFEADLSSSTVVVFNQAPTANSVATSGAEDAASIAVTLTGGDVDGTIASFTLSNLPANGSLYKDAGLTTVATTGASYAASGSSLTLYFVPDANYYGVTNFNFTATDTDGLDDSTTATATITVTSVNDAPTTNAAAGGGAEDVASIAITLNGGDIDGTVTSFSLSSLPADGILYTDAGLTTVAATGTDYAATGGSLTLYFAPVSNYFGVTTFDFAAKDDGGLVDASAATATITVTSVNDEPTTSAAVASGDQSATSIAITLTGSDIDGTVTSFSLSNLPSNGILYTDIGLTTVAATSTDYAATAESLTLYFAPNGTFNGITAFNFTAKDDVGLDDSSPATGTITITAVNGSTGNDTLNGTVAAETLNGLAGDDTIDGAAGSDTIYADLGTDTVVWDSSDAVIDGGGGDDTLRVDSGNADLTAFAGSITGIENVDLATDAGANVLTLVAQDVLDMSDTDTLTVDGDAGDSIDAGSGWTDGGVVGAYHVYTQGAATLNVDTDMSVNANILL